MWPTFFIPGCLPLGDPVGRIDHLCGVNATPYLIPAPLSVQDGHLQLVFVSPHDIAGGWPGIADGWRRIFYGGGWHGGSSGFGRGRQMAFWRIWATGAADFAVPTGATEVAWVSCTLGNPNLTDPFLSAWAFARNDGPYGSMPTFPASYIEPAASGDVILQFTSDTNELATSDEPDNEYIEFACKNMGTNPLNKFEGHIVSALYAEKGAASNLLRYSNDFTQAAWTKVNCSGTPNPAYGSKHRSTSYMVPNTANGYHYVEQEVTLEAGKHYTFAGRFGTLLSLQTTIWLTYVKPDATEHGVGMRTASQFWNLTGSTEVAWNTTPGGPSVVNSVSDNIPSISFNTFGYPFYCDMSGAYKFRIHSRSFGAQPYTAEVGNSNRWIIPADVVVQESPSNNSQPAFLTTGAAAITFGQSNYIRTAPPQLYPNVSDASRGYGGFLVRRGGTSSRPVTTLFNPAARASYLNFGDFGIVDTRYNGAAPDNTSPITTWASGLLYEWLSQKKFYFEAEVDSFGTGGTSAYYSLGFSPFERQLQSPVQLSDTGITTAYGGRAGQYAYLSTGAVYADGVLDGTYTAWSAGDFIGAAINFTDWEISFYRNGTLIRTVAIPNDEYRYALWAAVCAWNAEAVAPNQARFTYNFRGPFGGRKPSGFVALDFDNELA